MQIFPYLLLLVGLLVLKIPIIVSTGIITALYIVIQTTLPLDYIAVTVFQSLDQFTLLAIPLFIMTGSFMSSGGIAKHLLNLADKITGSFPGGIALTTVVACIFIADLTGSGPATVAAIGSITIPAMIQRGYAPGFACAVAACSGTLGVIIPPSNPMIVYAISGDVSVGQLFLAGFIPGFMLAASMMVPIYFISRKRGYRGHARRASAREVVEAAWMAKWALLVPVIILGGIYGGIFTPTESAAVACLYSFIVGIWIYGDFKWRDLPRIIGRTLLLIGAIMPIIAFATTFGQVITLDGVPTALASLVKSQVSSLWILLLLINVFLLFVGCFMEALAGIVLLTPLLLPMVRGMGMDPTHFGIVMIVNLGIGLMTPPLGINLFVSQSIGGKIRISEIVTASLPLIACMLICLLLLTYIPTFTLLLPNLFYGR